jgi:hypothetical protein
VCKVAAGVPLSHPRFRACLVSLFSDACLKQAPLSLILHVLVIAYEADVAQKNVKCLARFSTPQRR